MLIKIKILINFVCTSLQFLLMIKTTYRMCILICVIILGRLYPLINIYSYLNVVHIFYFLHFSQSYTYLHICIITLLLHIFYKLYIILSYKLILDLLSVIVFTNSK